MRQPLSLELADLARELHGGSDVPQTVDMMMRHARGVGRCDQVSVTVATKRRFHIASSRNSAAQRADQLQIDLGEGPWMAALAGADLVQVDDIRADHRWRRWGRAAADLGLRSALSVRLAAAGTIFGTLNLYSGQSRHFDDQHTTAVYLYAEHASVALHAAHRISSLRNVANERNLIGQAQGILAERHGVDADQAYSLLQAYARNNDVELRDGAGEVVAGRNQSPDESANGKAGHRHSGDAGSSSTVRKPGGVT